MKHQFDDAIARLLTENRWAAQICFSPNAMCKLACHDCAI